MQKNIKILVVVVVVISLVLTMGFIGCKATGTTATETTAVATTETTAATAQAKVGDVLQVPDTTGMKVGKVGFIPYHYENWSWALQGETVRKIIQDHGGTLVDFDPKGDPKKELDGFESLVSQGVSGIIFEGIDPVVLNDAAKTAFEAGVKLICIDPISASQYYNAMVNYNSVAMGTMCGESVVKALNGKGKIVIFNLPQALSCVEREKGFMDVLKTAPGIEILDTQRWGGTGEPTSPAAQTQMEAWLSKFPEIDGVFAVADNAGIGALAAIKAAGREKEIKIFGIDGSPEAIDAMKEANPAFYSTVCIFPKAIAEMTSAIMIQVLNGTQPAAKWIGVEGGLITIDDIKAGKTVDDVEKASQPLYKVIEEPKF